MTTPQLAALALLLALLLGALVRRMDPADRPTLRWLIPAGALLGFALLIGLALLVPDMPKIGWAP